MSLINFTVWTALDNGHPQNVSLCLAGYPQDLLPFIISCITVLTSHFTIDTAVIGFALAPRNWRS